MAGGGVAEYLTTADVAAMLGVTPATVRSYRAMSRPDARYSDHPFPAPDFRVGNTPVWMPERTPEIEQWAATRRGPGRPPKSPEDSTAQR
jgi:hypothetical protein